MILTEESMRRGRVQRASEVQEGTRGWRLAMGVTQLAGMLAIGALGIGLGASPALAQKPDSDAVSVASPGQSQSISAASAVTSSGASGSTESAELPDAPPSAVNAPSANSPAPVTDSSSTFQASSLVSGESSRGGIGGFGPVDGALWNSEDAVGFGVRPGNRAGYVALQDCPYDETRARECRMHWKPMLISSSIFLAFENAGNLYTGFWYRYETMHGKWWNRYVDSAAGWRWDRWSDNNPLLDDYVGHPMMGAVTNSIWIQNDPKGMTLELGNNWPYWRSRLRATAWSTFYSFQWKLGPIGEASIGHNGDHYFSDKGVLTNETGWVELVTTPVGGLGWNVFEDLLDKHVVRSLEDKSRNPVLLTVYQFMTPARGFANILRFRPPWYRDSRIVKANSFWGDPGEGVSASTEEAMKDASKHGEEGEDVSGEAAVQLPILRASTWQGPGGRHEIGAWWGVSLMSGHIWGYAKDVKYMPVDLHYSYELYRHKEQWAMRYSPELTAIAMLDWPTPNTTKSGTLYNQRTRAYGSGVSPVGFQWDLGPLNKVQPFFSGDGGCLYFSDRVLSPQGSQFMYTIDYGAGINFFRKRTQAVTIGYRYQHLSNANISHHNPGLDANTFYVSISRFRNRGD